MSVVKNRIDLGWINASVLAFLAAIAAGLALFVAAPVSAQSMTDDEKLRFVTGEHIKQTIYRKFDYEVSELLHMQSLAIISEHLDPSAVDETGRSELYLLLDNLTWSESRTIGLRRDLMRSKHVSDEDLAYFEDAFELFERMLEHATDVAHILRDEGDTLKASKVYMEHSIPISDQLKPMIYTLETASQKAVIKTARGY